MQDIQQVTNARPRRAGEEIWETTISGRVWVETTNEKGAPRMVSVGGREGARLRITTEDREIAQERIINRDLDPFVNGSLVRVDADQQNDERTKSVDALSTEQLIQVFSKTGKAFQTKVDGLGELTVRRMMDIAEQVDATNSQINYLRKSIEERWPIGGDTPTYREMQAAPR